MAKNEKWVLVTEPFTDDFYKRFVVEFKEHIDFLFIFAIQSMLSNGGEGNTPEETQEYVENNLEKVIDTLWEDNNLYGIINRERKRIVDILLSDSSIGTALMLNHKDDDFIADYWLSNNKKNVDRVLNAYVEWKESAYKSDSILKELLLLALKRSRVIHYSFYYLKEEG